MSERASDGIGVAAITREEAERMVKRDEDFMARVAQLTAQVIRLEAALDESRLARLDAGEEPRSIVGDHGEPEITDDQLRLLRVLGDAVSGPDRLARGDRAAIFAADREIQRLHREIDRLIPTKADSANAESAPCDLGAVGREIPRPEPGERS